jgi:hypothetical protein
VQQSQRGVILRPAFIDSRNHHRVSLAAEGSVRAAIFTATQGTSSEQMLRRFERSRSVKIILFCGMTSRVFVAKARTQHFAAVFAPTPSVFHRMINLLWNIRGSKSNNPGFAAGTTCEMLSFGL